MVGSALGGSVAAGFDEAVGKAGGAAGAPQAATTVIISNNTHSTLILMILLKKTILTCRLTRFICKTLLQVYKFLSFDTSKTRRGLLAARGGRRLIWRRLFAPHFTQAGRQAEQCATHRAEDDLPRGRGVTAEGGEEQRHKRA
jgi:hypothetical protein